jgi:hypothetical protein
MLGCNSAALLMWTTLRKCLARCDFECHKRLSLSSLNTNWFSDEMVKGSIHQLVSKHVHSVWIKFLSEVLDSFYYEYFSVPYHEFSSLDRS